MYDFSLVIAQLAQSIQVKDLVLHFTNFLLSTGVKKYNYTTFQQPIMHHNYDQSWCEKYMQRNFLEIDPAINITHIYNKMLSWKEVCSEMNNIHLTQSQKMLLLQMQNSVSSEGIQYGVCIPLPVHPFGQNGIYLAFHSEELTRDKEFMYQMYAVCTIFNNAFQESNARQKINNIKTPFPFSQKETKVISLMYNGKERRDIASMMDISINTVDTLTKRIFTKMRVNTKIQLVTRITLNGWSNAFMPNPSFH